MNSTLVYSDLRGGIRIVNPKSDPGNNEGDPGTLGFIATSDGVDRYLVSCFHVLGRTTDADPADAEPIYQPVDAGTPIANLELARTSRKLDCAAAKLITPKKAIGQILGIGRLAAPMDPIIGRRVIKSGMASGVTEGYVTAVTGNEVEIEPLSYPKGYRLSDRGDSGALWVDAATLAPVALHYRGNDEGKPERAFGKAILAVLEVLKLKFVVDELNV